MENKEPSKIVKLVFEEVSMQDSDKKGFKLSWETSNRGLSEIEREDATAAEVFACMSWDKIQEMLVEFSATGEAQMFTMPKKEGMN